MKTYVFTVSKTVEVDVLTEASIENDVLRLAADVAARWGHADSELISARVRDTEISQVAVLKKEIHHE